MFQKTIKSVFYLLIVIAICFVLHLLIFTYLNLSDANFKFTLLQLYAFFTFFTVVSEFVLQKIKQKNIDLVGNVFLGISLTKMMFCFIIGNYISNIPVQKNNFLVMFFIFLCIETVSTIKLLNNK
jgi:hypothetical protein